MAAVTVDGARIREWTRRVDPFSYELAHNPLVVLAAVGDLRHFERVAADFARDFPGERFIGIVSADRVDDIDFPLRALSILLAEVIFTASSVPSGVQGTILASRALDVIGMGQDFVFTVPRLGDAVRYALDELAANGPMRGKERASWWWDHHDMSTRCAGSFILRRDRRRRNVPRPWPILCHFRRLSVRRSPAVTAGSRAATATSAARRRPLRGARRTSRQSGACAGRPSPWPRRYRRTTLRPHRLTRTPGA